MKTRDYRAHARAFLRGNWIKTTAILLLASLLGAHGGISSGFSVSGSGASEQELQLVRNNLQMLPQEYWNMLLMIVGIVVVVSLVALLVYIFLGSWVNVGLYNMGWHMMQGEKPRAGMLFVKGIYWKSVRLNLLINIYITLWSMLFFIPGVIAAYRYSMAPYFLYRDPSLTATQALEKSKQHMAGYKAGLFVLNLSFIGWALLASLPVLLWSVIGVSVGIDAAMWTLPVATLVTLIAATMLNAYVHMSSMVFFRERELAGPGVHYAWMYENDGGAEEKQAFEEDMEAPAPEAAPAPVDESEAKAMFLRNRCSRRQLREAGLLEEYEAMGASSISEESWKRDYLQQLMRRFDREPAALDDILDICAEYALDDFADRALQRIERHLRQETLPAQEILNMSGRMLAMLTSGVFADNEGFVARKKAEIADLADRLEARLQGQPGDDWRQALNLIRSMCK